MLDVAKFFAEDAARVLADVSAIPT